MIVVILPCYDFSKYKFCIYTSSKVNISSIFLKKGNLKKKWLFGISEQPLSTEQLKIKHRLVR